MSYNLLVFDKSKAPDRKEEFKKWFESKASCPEERDYCDVKDTSKPLVDFFMELNESFPERNGPYAPKPDADLKSPGMEDRLTDYTIDTDMIYMGFAWTMADEAKKLVHELAKKNDLGFCDMRSIYWSEDHVEEMAPDIGKDGQQKKKDVKKAGVGFRYALIGIALAVLLFLAVYFYLL